MARKPPSKSMRNRAAKTAAALASPSVVAQAEPKKRVSIGQFFREVRQEARRITWTSRRETWITSVMVAIMVGLAMGFFAAVDTFFGWGVPTVLRLANAG
jgi:preprotein translocase subunit SecE